MLAGNIIRQFFTQIIGLITGLGISIITTRILGVSGRGDFSLIINSSNFFSLLFGFSLGSALVHVVASEKAPFSKTVNTFFLVNLMIICLFAVIVFLLPNKAINFWVPESEEYFLNKVVLIVLFASTLLGVFINSILNGKRIFREQQIVYYWIAPITLGLYILLFILNQTTKIDFNLFIIFYIAVSVIPVISSFVIYSRKVSLKFSWSFLDKLQLSYVFRFSLLAYLANIFQFLSYRMDFWIVEHFNGSRSLGIYSLSVNLAQMLWLLPQAVSTILISYSGAESEVVAINYTNILCRFTFNLVFIATLLLFLVIGYFIPFLYGEEFYDSIFLFRILIVGILPFSLTTIIASYFAGKGIIKVNLICSIIGFTVCLLLDLMLIPIYGNIGAAIATICSYFSSTIFLVYLYLKKTGSNILDVVFLKKSDLQIVKNLFAKKVM